MKGEKEVEGCCQPGGPSSNRKSKKGKLPFLFENEAFQLSFSLFHGQRKRSA